MNDEDTESPEHSASPETMDELEQRAGNGVTRPEAPGIGGASTTEQDHPFPPNEMPDGWLFRRARE